MLYNLVVEFQDKLDSIPLLRWIVGIMWQVEFRAFAAVLISFSLALWQGPGVIAWLQRKKIGDTAEFGHEEINRLMQGRSGVPTMGGIFLCGSILVTTALLADVWFNRYIQISLIVLVWMSGVGAIDDWLKLTSSQRKPGSRDGLYSWEKLVFQVGLGLVVGYFVYTAAKLPDAHVLNLPLQRTYPPTAVKDFVGLRLDLAPSVIVLGVGAFAVLCAFFMTGFSNAVNITDGMDGLAGGNMVITSFALMVLAYISGHANTAYFLLVPYVPGSAELMVLAGSMAGATLGFLWFNAHPARVFMGDTGSLALGALMGYIGVVTRNELLLPVIGAVYVIEISTVMIQVSWFKWTKRRFGEGRRIFRSTPIHHGFHLNGWAETQIVTRSYIVSAVAVVIALVVLKLR